MSGSELFARAVILVLAAVALVAVVWLAGHIMSGA